MKRSASPHLDQPAAKFPRFEAGRPSVPHVVEDKGQAAAIDCLAIELFALIFDEMDWLALFCSKLVSHQWSVMVDDACKRKVAGWIESQLKPRRERIEKVIKPIFLSHSARSLFFQRSGESQIEFDKKVIDLSELEKSPGSPLMKQIEMQDKLSVLTKTSLRILLYAESSWDSILRIWLPPSIELQSDRFSEHSLQSLDEALDLSIVSGDFQGGLDFIEAYEENLDVFHSQFFLSNPRGSGFLPLITREYYFTLMIRQGNDMLRFVRDLSDLKQVKQTLLSLKNAALKEESESPEKLAGWLDQIDQVSNHLKSIMPSDMDQHQRLVSRS